MTPDPLAGRFPFEKRSILLLAILLVALVLRLGWLTSFTEAINGEGAEYARIAENLAAGRGYVGIATEGRELMLPPLYPALIVAGSVLTGDFYHAAELICLAAGVLALLPLFGVARDLYGDEVAYLALGVAALHPVLIRLSATTWSESLYIALALSGIYWVNHAQLFFRDRSWLLAGAFVGLAYLTRPEAILFACMIVTLQFLLYQSRRLVSVRQVLLFAGAFVAVAAPYIVYLSVSTGEFRVEGKTIVNNELGRRQLSGVESERAAYEVTEHLEEKGVYMQSNADIARSSGSANYYRMTLRLMQSSGVRNVVKVVKAFATDPFLGAPLILPLALLGLIRGAWTPARARGELVLLLAASGTLITLTTLIHYSSARFYFPLIPLLVLWAAKGISELMRLARTRRLGFGGRAVGALAFLALVSLFAFGADDTRVFEADTGPLNRQIRSAGAWLAALQGHKTVMDVGTTLAFHAGAKYVPMPYCDSRTALRYAEKKHVDFIVVRSRGSSRPYLQEWRTTGIHEHKVTLAHVSGSDPSNQVLIYRLDKPD